MALIFRLDPKQLQSIINAIEQGFDKLVVALGADDTQDQEKIDTLAESVRSSREKLQTSVDSQKGE